MKKIPLRSMFIPAKDYYFLAFDLAQAESWVVAYLAQEPTMKYALAHSDFHTETATALFDKPFDAINKEERYLGKRYNHASAYRMSYVRAAEIINKDAPTTNVTVTLAESKKFSERWHSKYYIKGWWKEIEIQLSETRTLITPYGRKRQFFNLWGDELFKEATAFVPQSTVADHMNGFVQPELEIRGGLIEVKKYCDAAGLLLVHSAHDSALIEVPKTSYKEHAEVIYNLLYRPMVIRGEEFKIPVDAEYGERLGELQSIPRAELIK